MANPEHLSLITKSIPPINHNPSQTQPNPAMTNELKESYLNTHYKVAAFVQPIHIGRVSAEADALLAAKSYYPARARAKMARGPLKKVFLWPA